MTPDQHLVLNLKAIFNDDQWMKKHPGEKIPLSQRESHLVNALDKLCAMGHKRVRNIANDALRLWLEGVSQDVRDVFKINNVEPFK